MAGLARRGQAWPSLAWPGWPPSLATSDKVWAGLVLVPDPSEKQGAQFLMLTLQEHPFWQVLGQAVSGAVVRLPPVSRYLPSLGFYFTVSFRGG